MSKPQPVHQVLREARERLGKTQTEVAGELGVTQPLIAKWERGEGLPRTEDVRDVARVYRLKPEQLLPERAA